ncbi:MAG: hypothetical protein QM765_36260 [Myxococcales bacterium]
MTPQIALLAALVLASNARADPVAVSVDFAPLDAETYAGIDGYALQKLVVLRLVQEGFAVVAPTETPQVRISLARDADDLVLEAKSTGAQQQRRVKYREVAPPELHIEVAHRVASLARACSPPPSPPPPPPAPAAQAPSQPFQLTAGVSAVWRSSAVDVLPRIAARGGIRGGWGIRGELSFDTAQASRLRVWEVQPQAGPSLLIDLKQDWLQLEAALLVGALVHVYRLDDAARSDGGGTVADFLGTVPVALTFWPHPSLGLELRAAVGLASSGRRHQDESGILWERGPLRFEGGLGAHWRF